MPANRWSTTIRAAGGEAFALQARRARQRGHPPRGAETSARLGGIDVLVNNAGSLVKRVPIAEFDDALFDEVLHINARSVLAFCREVVPLMRAQGRGGSIINVSSVAARNGGGPGAYLYAGAKGFVSTATRGLAKELAPRQHPRQRGGAGRDPDALPRPLLDAADARSPSRPRSRWPASASPTTASAPSSTSPREQLSGYVTGQILEVNGGQYMP